ncbi:UNVERIFIED_CONTAM: Gibberellin 20 oxidase 2 [Sesamum radiatum]|uniref:Gibberellin 20 oxidase 2 n=1 Tax=Sesamum radiatum TaxID=300843 RepID=A0AAW2V749_SESRA
MDSSASTLILFPPLDLKTDRENGVLVFDTTLLEKQPNLPTQFLWPHEDLAYAAEHELPDPPVDLKGFLNGDQEATVFAAAQIRRACLNHGFFQVVNHGVDASLVHAAHQHMDAFFKLPLSTKLRIKREQGSLCGYSGAHADRFSSKLPWKETLSFTYKHANEPTVLDVVNYIKSSLGKEFEGAGHVYQKYCEEMKNLSLSIMELLAIGLGVERSHYRKFFEDGGSVMRGNNYPPCKQAGLTLGTGPHSDPNSLTILHQDEVGGLEIFADSKWQGITPRPDAFVVNIGDTLMALSNGRYKSCIHRAVVNKERVRRSLVFFVNPKEDKVVRPPQDLMCREEPREYPDFTWLDLQQFTQNHYRADTTTLQNFVHWLYSNTRT